MGLTTTSFKINADSLNALLKELKSKYNVDNVDETRKKQIINLIKEHGYLPYPHIKALKELSSAETLIALEEKLKLNNTYNQSGFNFQENAVSPAKRAGFKNAAWMQKEEHNIKLVNLSGLGNGNESKEPGRFIDWLKQIAILPSGKPDKGILATTVYLVPFHPREFGCAYIPKHSGASDGLKDESINLSTENLIKAFIAIAQLAGHPVIYDILPQTGRFSKIILANPFAARWFSINELKNIEDENDRQKASKEMMNEQNQQIIYQKAKSVINSAIGKAPTDDITEQDISDAKHGEIIGKLIHEGLWPAPGGAWNSAGVPVYDKMSDDGGYPMFKHYDFEGNDVTHYANLDCQTPYYFVCLENGKYNNKVIDFFINFMKKLQKDYNFDGFRVDHIDHITDKFSENNLVPISYRAPRAVLSKLNSEMKKEIPHFASLAEYMLWDDMYEEYHKAMGFDVLWGNDIISQYQKDVARIIEDNEQLEIYNKTAGIAGKLSILKAYNNQDGEFREINQYPGQLGEEGALFKWFKLKFLPGGELAQRPVLFLDGDESFTKTGIEHVINSEEAMQRAENCEFFNKFDAIDRLAKNCEIVSSGKAAIYKTNESGLAAWLVENKSCTEKLLVVANEKPPTEVLKQEDEWVNIKNTPVKNAEITVPQGYSVISEFVYNNKSASFEEISNAANLSGNTLRFTQLNPGEFHVYRLKKAV